MNLMTLRNTEHDIGKDKNLSRNDCSHRAGCRREDNKWAC